MAARVSVISQPLLLRVAMCAGLAAPLCACESQPDTLRIGKMVYEQIAGVGDSESVPLTEVVAIPYATLGVRLGSSAEAMFVLESRSGAALQWVGGKEFAISTRDGRILRTSGFVHNLSGFLEETAQPSNDSTASRDYRYDLADMNAYGVSVHCNEHDAGQEQIVILGDMHQTRHVIEDCVATELDWSFSNEFWTDVASNYVWRSVQYVHPGLDPIALETLRPAD